MFTSKNWSGVSATQRGFFALQFLIGLISYIATTWGLIDLMKVDLFADQSREMWISAVLTVAISTAVIFAMLVGLHAFLDRKRSFSGRLTGLISYIFFVFWSIAFGYGFFWKTFASEDFTREQFDEKAAIIRETVDATLGSLEQVSRMASTAAEEAARLSELEANVGKTCKNNPDSPPNQRGVEGPLTKARRLFSEDAARASNEIDNNWIAPLEDLGGDLNWRLRVLNRERVDLVDPKFATPNDPVAGDDDRALSKLIQDTETSAESRTAAYERVEDLANSFVSRARQARLTTGKQTQAKFEELATEMSEEQGRLRRKWCQDDELASIMTSAADTIKNLPAIEKMDFESTEAAAATQRATLTLGSNVLYFIRSILGSKPQAVPAALRDNDIIALFATLGVDFALFFVAFLSRPPVERPSSTRIGRLLRRVAFWRDPNVYQMQEDAEATDRIAEATQTVSESKSRLKKAERDAKRLDLEDEISDLKTIKEQKELEDLRDALKNDTPLQFATFDLIREDQRKLLKELEEIYETEETAREIASRTVDLIERYGGHHYLAVVYWQDLKRGREAKRFANMIMSNPSFRAQPMDPADEAAKEVMRRLQANPNMHIEGENVEIFRISDRLASVIMRISSLGDMVAGIESVHAAGDAEEQVDTADDAFDDLSDTFTTDDPAFGFGDHTDETEEAPNFFDDITVDNDEYFGSSKSDEPTYSESSGTSLVSGAEPVFIPKSNPDAWMADSEGGQDKFEEPAFTPNSPVNDPGLAGQIISGDTGSGDGEDHDSSSNLPKSKGLLKSTASMVRSFFLPGDNKDEPQQKELDGEKPKRIRARIFGTKANKAEDYGYQEGMKKPKKRSFRLRFRRK